MSVHDWRWGRQEEETVPDGPGAARVEFLVVRGVVHDLVCSVFFSFSCVDYTFSLIYVSIDESTPHEWAL